MTVTVSSSNFTKVTGNPVTSLNLVLPSDVPSGATIVLIVVQRAAETAALSSVADPVNGTWDVATVRQGPVDSAGATARTWYVALTNSAALTGAGNRTITATIDTSSNMSVAGGWISSDLGALTFDAMATVANNASGSTDQDSNTAAATGAGAIIGAMWVNNAQTANPTMDGAGESNLITYNAGSESRTLMCGETYASAGNYGFETTISVLSAANFHVGAFKEPGGGDPPPSITDVDEDNTVTLTQTNIEIDGTDFDTATVDITQGANTFACSIDSQSGTAIQFDMPSLATAAPKHGAATVLVTNGDDQDDTQAITISAVAGSDYVDVGTPNADPDLTPDPLHDLVSGDQVRWTVTEMGFDQTDFTLNDDLTYEFTEGLPSVDLSYWDQSDQTWSDYETFTFGEVVEGDTTPDAFSFSDQFGTATSATITSAAITVSGIDAASAITVSGGTYDINASGSFTSDAGTVNNGDTVRARHTSSASYSTATNTTVTIGGVSDTFTSLTGSDPELATAHGHAANPGGMGRMMGRS
jgi:hypothetical protein